jgi:NCAIR mutase (PurE)-related protein
MSNDPPTHELARQLINGDLNEQQFLHAIGRQTFAALQGANIDLDRQRRVGFPEVIFGEGKTDEVLIEIINRLQAARQPVLATRITRDQASAVQAVVSGLTHHPVACTLRSNDISENVSGQVSVVTAGTGDLPVAQEACETLRWMGVGVTLVSDVGVAGPHRLPAHLDQLDHANAVVVAAGMEGALPSVVAGYVAVPVIAVPTSVGYGANFDGLSALLSMLNSCAANVAVVNIDAGFKAGYLAGLIAKQTTPPANPDG